MSTKTRKRIALIALHLLRLPLFPFYWIAVFAKWIYESIEACTWPDRIHEIAMRVKKWGAA